MQFPYAVSFTNAAPQNVIYPRAEPHRDAPACQWRRLEGQHGATVDATAYVGPNAQVLDTAQVLGNARIEDYAVVRNSAQVRDNAVVSGHAVVQDNAQVYGNAKVRDWARVFGYAEIYENAKVIEHGNCGDGNAATHTKVYGNAVVKGTTYVYDTSTFSRLPDHGRRLGQRNGTTPATTACISAGSWGQDTARFTALADNHYLIRAAHASRRTTRCSRWTNTASTTVS